VAALIVVAGVDALRSPDDEAAATATEAATTPAISATTTIATIMEDQNERALAVMDQKPEAVVDEAGNPLPACTREQLAVGLPPLRNVESDGYTGPLWVRPIDACRQDFPYFRVALVHAKQLLVFSGRLFYVSSETGQTLAHYGPIPCRSFAIVPALVTVGYEPSPTPQGHVFRLEVRCE